MSLVLGIDKKYEDFHLKVPRWEILDQGITALLGPSGSGKTTVFRILLGLEKCDNYVWNFKGCNLAELTPSQKNIGVVFQSFELFPHMTVNENILFAAQARKLSQGEFQNDLQEIIERLQIKNILHKKANVISGGEKQRAALARALIGRPQILFLDEPFSALDMDLRSESRALVKEIIRSRNIPAVLITHDIEDVKYLATKITHIKNGLLHEE